MGKVLSDSFSHDSRQIQKQFAVWGLSLDADSPQWQIACGSDLTVRYTGRISSGKEINTWDSI